MGLMKHLRSKPRLKEERDKELSNSPSPPRYARDLISRLPEDLVHKILAEVCPHTQDHSYLPSEQSTVGEGCMLCDLRDLARCARVCRRWYALAQDLL